MNNKRGFINLILAIIASIFVVGSLIYIFKVRTNNTSIGPAESVVESSTQINSPASVSSSTPITAVTSTASSEERPQCTFSANPQQVPSTGALVGNLTWQCRAVSSCSITSDHGDSFPGQDSSGILHGVILTSRQTTNYMLTCHGTNGSTVTNTTQIKVFIPPQT